MKNVLSWKFTIPMSLTLIGFWILVVWFLSPLEKPIDATALSIAVYNTGMFTYYILHYFGAVAIPLVIICLLVITAFPQVFGKMEDGE